MNDIAIRARHVSKSYRLYDTPSDRLLDLLGLLPNAKKKVRQHLAVNDVSFEIRRGEKIGLIGRNGAGKSTLLKMITRVTDPTSGTLEVHGESRALLQIGTGFHPDFTGRENVRAYLASLGVGEREAKPLITDAIEFAELENFADQPVKTYSTGMGMRLMFAASTMMKPDLLVIDEVLGVGDAYFQRKSFERIREMCEGRETTLLLVTHDVYSAASLCDRMIWIDHGRILIDADPPTVTRAYEDAVREQEERRLRLKALKYAGERGERARKERLVVEIQSKDNQPPLAPVWFCRATLLQSGVPVASLRFGEDAFEARGGASLQREGSNWGDLATIEGRLARPLRTHGSPFHKVAGVFEIDAVDTIEARDFAIAIDYYMEAPSDLRVSLTSAEWRVDLGVLPPLEERAWTTHEAVATTHAGGEADANLPPALNISDWNNWSVVADGTIVEIGPDLLNLAWHGAPGPYLMMGPPIHVSPGASLLLPISASVKSGRLGIGALNDAGQWINTHEIIGTETKTLDFAAGETAHLTLVLYSAAPEPLAAQLRHADGSEIDSSVNTRGVYGAGDIRIESFRVIEQNGRETPVLEVNRAAAFELAYAIARPDLRERAQVVLAFKRHGVEDVFRVICRELLFDGSEMPRGVVRANLDPLPLAPGDYSITVLVAAEGYYEETQDLYFSMNPKVYFAQSVAAEISVAGASQIHQGTAVVGVAEWHMEGANTGATAQRLKIV
ncbi:ABC transporter ATP-binding protein [Vitreimonas sp.]|uniref:ABC transporter ATP-binding protein n=1 Tax=Vitreimonas sp. TaxID=3069702 RepID=UPI002ED77CF7